ncbi:hypothetical protein EC973_009680 [Apophysomyces ossiformis]|uniref:HCP-like protein n=1 Tax=Apophysomyces ossiformis TaxID=679940 RepID=A0A8H7BL87_9FUNG|nr:hypothetical protein EC973_009680 [Apophysomyces ossiformis]
MASQRYASQPARRGRADPSASGIFAPFLNPTSAKEKIEAISPSDLLAKANVADLLPSDEQLETFIKQKYISLPIETQKQIVENVLNAVKQDRELDQESLLQHGHPVALKLYQCAMEHGDDRGKFSYANMIYRGYNGTPKNEDLGIKLMSELAQKGHPYAQMNLASILMRTQPDRVEAGIKLYELAGKSGIDSAYTELGRMYRLGYGVHQDHAKAIAYFRQGAQTGNPQCNFMLGVYYSSGLGTEDRQPDQQKAFKHFQKAALKGLPEAQYNVGLRFLNGHGVEQNSFNAAEFLRMAAEHGFQLAQANLAGMYAEGRGVKKNLNEARQWLEKAAAGGGPIGKDAQKRLAELGGQKGGSKCTIM